MDKYPYFQNPGVTTLMMLIYCSGLHVTKEPGLKFLVRFEFLPEKGREALELGVVCIFLVFLFGRCNIIM
jgi:hypothetical protein